jgi:hypothetical protein
MSDIWESSWDVLSETFQRIALSLNSQYPEMSWSSGHSDNRAFAFRAYAAFRRDRDTLRDVVASVDFRRFDSRLHYSADIGLDDGTVLADGPQGVVDASEGLRGVRAEIDAAIRDIVKFLEDGEQVLRGAIGDGPLPHA